MTSVAEPFDVVVAGAGAAGLAAAGMAAQRGMRTVLLEATELIGGTSALSGGMVWCPGAEDALAATYLDGLIPAHDPQHPVREAFLRHAAAAIADLQSAGLVTLRPVPTYPDYEPDLPGAALQGRVLEPLAFDGTRLGADFARLRPPLPEFTLCGGMMVNRVDLPHLRNIGRSWRSTWRAAQLLAIHARQRLTAPRGTTLHLGNALIAGLLLGARQAGVSIRTGQRVAAASRAAQGGFTLRLAEGGSLWARRALILAGGGFAHDPALSTDWLPAAARGISACAPGADGSLLQLGLVLGGRMQPGLAGNGFWTPLSRVTRADGNTTWFPHTVTDRAKPGVIAVGQDARRFTNEARSYHEVGRAMLALGLDHAFLLCDRRGLWRYGLGRVKPFHLAPGGAVRAGALVRAGSIDALAVRLGLDPATLEATIARFNRHAAAGADPDFHRGGDAYQRHMGDAAHHPNPCVAPLRAPPFYAVKIQPGTLGTAAGLKTDGLARVLDADDHPIAGLYACGNDMASPFAGTYPGPGITLGPALTFAWLAANHSAGLRPPSEET